MSIVLDGTVGITGAVNLTTTGNTILGDASTDTLNVGNNGLVKDASGNVMIGNATAITSSAGRGYLLVNGSSNALIDFGVSGASVGYIYHTGTDLRLFNAQAGALQLYTSGTERMRIDSDGNLGLGVTPSAWDSGRKAIEFGAGNCVYSNYTNQIGLVSNAYYNGTNWIYKTTASAGYYTNGLGNHAWYTAPSGTAGNAITFTQAMALDASGNLSVTGAVQANFNYADTGVASYGAGTSFTLTVSDTTEGAMYLISVSRNTTSTAATNRVSLLSYRSSGSFLTDIVANANVTISVSGTTITVTGVGTASLYGSVLGLRN